MGLPRRRTSVLFVGSDWIWRHELTASETPFSTGNPKRNILNLIKSRKDFIQESKEVSQGQHAMTKMSETLGRWKVPVCRWLEVQRKKWSNFFATTQSHKDFLLRLMQTLVGKKMA